MNKLTVNEKGIFLIHGNDINGEEVFYDLIQTDNKRFHVLENNKGYNVEVIAVNMEEKSMIVRVNGNDYEISIKDKYDLLLEQMGINNESANKVNHFKAPMPGLIKEIKVSEGDAVKKGDVLLILEAMKMENALKSPTDGKIKKQYITKGQAVEKGQFLFDFE